MAHECPIDVLEEGVHFDFLCTSLGTQPPGRIPHQQLAYNVLHRKGDSEGIAGPGIQAMLSRGLAKSVQPCLSSTDTQTAGIVGCCKQ